MNSLIEPNLQAQPENLISAETMIDLEDVSVRYRAPQETLGTLKEYAILRLQQRVRYTDFFALRGISLEVRRGEIFGIIGRNGAGKSTLLKVISRVLIPTQGRVRVWGRVSPLLELGAGFHVELTGLENIFLNGTLLGRSRKEIESRIEDILNFSELGGFINAPLRTYSSGMVARLAFAVATSWEPEILIVDEVLAVGDEPFRNKCEIRMKGFRSKGTTTLLVTHNMNTILSMCSRVAWIEHGRIMSIGPTMEVVEAYRQAKQSGTV
jgi:ABC-2 type transport system ATP-binding protein